MKAKELNLGDKFTIEGELGVCCVVDKFTGSEIIEYKIDGKNKRHVCFFKKFVTLVDVVDKVYNKDSYSRAEVVEIITRLVMVDVYDFCCTHRRRKQELSDYIEQKLK